MPYRMTPSVRHRAIEVYYYYYYYHLHSVMSVLPHMLSLTLPVTVATFERSFSKLKLIKNYTKYHVRKEVERPGNVVNRIIFQKVWHLKSSRHFCAWEGSQTNILTSKNNFGKYFLSYYRLDIVSFQSRNQTEEFECGSLDDLIHAKIKPMHHIITLILFNSFNFLSPPE